ncbi:MAG: helix-turn-helix transcriptional regulator [Actinomycetota bacterium]
MPPAESRKETRPARASERLRRLLSVVPYVIQHQGAELSALSSVFGVSESELAQDLDLLFVSGLPPYGPGDLIEVRVEDGRVWIDMADYFDRPLRLTRNEALALYLRATELAATPGLPEADAVRSALGKLEEALGPAELGALSGHVEASEHGEASGALGILRDAVARRERVEIEYYAASSTETSVRTIDPEELFSALGHWYVVAWDDRSDSERMFRVDRVRRSEATGERFEPRGLLGAGRPLYSASEEDRTVRLALRPAARWVAEYYRADVEGERDGEVVVSLPARRLEWLVRLVLQLGPDARIVEPPELAQAVRELAGSLLERYGGSASNAS